MGIQITSDGRPTPKALHRPWMRGGYVDPSAEAGRKPRAAIQGRKSHHTEGKSKSVREQIAECRKICEVMGFEVSEERIYAEAEGVKGAWWWPEENKTGPFRPVLGRLVQDVRDGLIDVIVTWKSDRLYRNVGVAHELLSLLNEHNVRLVANRHDYHIHTSTGLANAKQEAVRNEEMVGKTSEDIIRDLDFKMHLGQVTRSPACLGFRSAGNDTQAAIAIPEEIALVRRIFRMYVFGEDDERGPLCRNAIANQLMVDGIMIPRLRRTDKGESLETIDGKRIQRVLRHVAYAGKMKHAHQVYGCDQFLVPASDNSGRRETVIPLSLWQEANDKLDRETKADKRRKHNETPHLLTGTAVCGRCGRNVYALGGWKKGNVLVTPFKLTCTNREGENKCPRDAARKTPQEEIVEAWVLSELFPLLAAEIEATRTSAGRDTDVQRLAALRQQTEQAQIAERRKLRRALDAVDSGAMDEEQYGQLAVDLRAERESLARETEALEKRLSQSAPLLPDLSAEGVAQMPKTALRAAVQAALDWIAICPTGVMAKTRWGTYTAAKYRRPYREAGEHHSATRIGKATAVDSLEALSFLPDPAHFVRGRRKRLGDASEGFSDWQILPGYDSAAEVLQTDEDGDYLPTLHETEWKRVGGEGKQEDEDLAE